MGAPDFCDIIGYRKKENTMTNTPADWAFERAAELANENDWGYNAVALKTRGLGKAFARYIEQHEEAPVDPDLEIAREAADAMYEAPIGSHIDGDTNVEAAYKAIKLARERGKL